PDEQSLRQNWHSQFFPVTTVTGQTGHMDDYQECTWVKRWIAAPRACNTSPYLLPFSLNLW
ncbi:hypothetical protein, partial [Acetobacter fallax]|uniref:hypothetical protein n=1 Tax=Acetobacter fallax TaxID=1737473 RepID=UPI001A7EA715